MPVAAARFRTPEYHAGKAAALLARLDELGTELAELDEMKRLELEVTGAARSIGRQQDWTLSLANAHALTAIALSLLERRV